MSYSVVPQELSNAAPNDTWLSLDREIQAVTTISRGPVHHNDGGINSIVDSAAFIFSILNKLRTLKTHPSLHQLHQELHAEINNFQENIQFLGYSTDYVIVCRYILCATIDDIIPRKHWGGQWPSLLETFKLDVNHEERYFAILDRALGDPISYIDLMELIYLCLNAGYKGHYRDSDHNHYQLEQITNNLYQHIKSYRGNISKNLSTSHLKPIKHTATVVNSKSPLSFIFISAACVVMAIFISLGYLMDVISNEANEQISQLNSSPTFTNKV